MGKISPTGEKIPNGNVESKCAGDTEGQIGREERRGEGTFASYVNCC